MTTTDIDTLARAATPGPWEFVKSPEWGYSCLWNPETRQEILVPDGKNDGDRPITWMGEELSDANRAFIEAANPTAILALIDENRVLEQALREAREALKVFSEVAEFYSRPHSQPETGDHVNLIALHGRKETITVGDLRRAARAYYGEKS